jgi:hypothetical protein
MPDVIYKLVLETDKFKEQWAQVRASAKDFADVITKTQTEIDGVDKEFADALTGIETAYDSLKKEAENSSIGVVQSIKMMVTEYDKFRNIMVQQGGLTGAAGEMMPKQISGIQTAASSFKSTMLAELPFGGLIGLMLLGGKRDEEIRAASTQAMRVFQESGTVVSGQLQSISKDAYNLGVRLGKGPTGMFGEFQASASAFARAGMDIGEVIDKKVALPFDHVKNNVLNASVEIDSLFKLGAGTSAAAMATLVKDFNVDAAESARVVASIGFAARDSGTSVTSFMNSVMSSAAALRTQRVDIEEVANAQARLSKAMKDQLPGVSPQYAAAYAERAIGQISTGLAGMSVGLTAVLGERISGRTNLAGGQVTGLQAYYAMKEGFEGKGQGAGSGVFQESIQEIGKMAMEAGSSFEEQRFFIEKILPGVSTEGSRAILEIAKETKEGTPLKVALDKHQKELSKAFVDRGAEQSNLMRSMMRIQQGIAEIGAGLLGQMITGFKLMYHIGGMILETLMHPLTTTDQFKIHEYYAGQLSNQATKMTNRVIGGVNEVLSGIGQAAETFGISKGESESEVRKKLGIQSYATETKTTTGVFGIKTSREFAKEGEIERVFAEQSTERLAKELEGMKIKNVGKVLEAYQEEEAKSGKGETVFRKLGLPKGTDIEKIEAAAGRAEASTMKEGTLRMPDGKELSFDAVFTVKHMKPNPQKRTK